MISTKPINLERNNYTQIEAKGDIPSQRRSHTAILIGNEVIMFGGKTGGGNTCLLLNDTHSLDMIKFIWTKLALYGTKPPGRMNHTACLSSDQNQMLM